MNPPSYPIDYSIRATPEGGVATLELLIALCLLVATGFIVRSFPQSTSVIKVEASALGTIIHIIEAEERFRQLNENGLARFAGLGELVGRADDVGLRLPVGARYDHRNHTLIVNDYCFFVFLVDQQKTPVHTYRDQVRSDFFVAYAWPLNHGSKGRRVFVGSNGGEVRSWENPNGIIEGIHSAAPARLANPPPNTKWPLGGDRPKWYEGIIWRSVR